MCKFSPGDIELEVRNCSFLCMLHCHMQLFTFLKCIDCVCMMTASSDLWSPINHIAHILVQHQSMKRHRCYA